VEEQQLDLREATEIIIATPDHLKDVFESHVLVLSQCRYVIVDKADVRGQAYHSFDKLCRNHRRRTNTRSVKKGRTQVITHHATSHRRSRYVRTLRSHSDIASNAPKHVQAALVKLTLVKSSVVEALVVLN